MLLWEGESVRVCVLVSCRGCREAREQSERRIALRGWGGGFFCWAGSRGEAFHTEAESPSRNSRSRLRPVGRRRRRWQPQAAQCCPAVVLFWASPKRPLCLFGGQQHGNGCSPSVSPCTRGLQDCKGPTARPNRPAKPPDPKMLAVGHRHRFSSPRRPRCSPGCELRLCTR